MKTLPVVIFLSAFVAFLVPPLSFEFSSSLVVASGLAAILVADYSSHRFRVARFQTQQRTELQRELDSVLRLAA